MICRTHEDFWRCFDDLPAAIQQQARERFHHWQEDAFDASLHFKPLCGDIWSVRVNPTVSGFGRRKEHLIVWFWIGTHAEYDELIKRWR